MAIRKPMIFARVEDELRERVKDSAERRFQGNESMLVRDAVVLYCDLLEAHGANFDLIVAGLRTSAQKDPVAA